MNRVVRLGNLGDVTRLLAEWEKVRLAILAGAVTGFSTVLRGQGGTETCYTGGIYKTSKKDALRAVLRMSKSFMEDDAQAGRYGS